MVMYFGDIGKSAKDLLTGGYQYDHKFSASSSTDSGVTFTVNGKRKGDAVCGDLKGTYKTKGVTVEATMDNSNKADLVVTVDDIAPSLKAAISCNPFDGSSGKLALTYAKAALGVKADSGLRSSPKMNVNVCYTSGAIAAGCSASIDAAKGNVSKYEGGAQYDAGEYVVSTMVANNIELIKFAVLHKTSKTVQAAAEVSYKAKTNDTCFCVGALSKLDGGAVAKATVSSAGIVGLQWSQTLQPKTTGTFNISFDAKNPNAGSKFGMEIKMKP
mmetsp:Transcript_8707/g.11790  ORF Transcript_8707/g.11790 Transcript_8707/m.11790 type:complete len:272 (+) Transcript_8707:85-900(+)|eukprot:CAMPEP_0196578418 /NCGR_PEP_ID=MMETSP1081-20130531/7319_1 /TAXON_ID=36882 /ORGANISM="Pyramimonas amylifera, Strain CCMP720" /LENGTH=271 /DNA_ID=CAMNT_0041897625 /DNA_START=87 /DNA_END=902 /DNA_ORIENTATION=+